MHAFDDCLSVLRSLGSAVHESERSVRLEGHKFPTPNAPDFALLGPT